MANDKDFKVKNGIQPTVYHEGVGTVTSGSVGYSLSSASYDNKSFSVSSQDSNSRGFSFNDNGTKLYTVGGTNDSVYQYSLSTAYDISTASYDSVSFSVVSQDAAPYGITFKPDGTKMYVLGASSDAVYQYSLSTAYDISTASYDSVSFSFASQDTGGQHVLFNNDGTLLYITGSVTDSVYQYSLSTAYDLSTASYASVSFSFASQDINPNSITFNTDGTKMYMMGNSGDDVDQYSLSTAYNIGTASYDSVSFNVTSQTTGPFNAIFNNDGSRMYVLGGNTIYQYSTVLTTNTLDLSTGSVFEITPTSDIQVGLSNPAASGTVSQATLLLDGAATSTHDLSATSFETSLDVSSQDTAPTDLFIADSGTKLYLVGEQTDDIYQYNLSTAWDISTATSQASYAIPSGNGTNPTGIFVKPDGTTLYVSMENTEDITQYSMSTPFDLSTISDDAKVYTIPSGAGSITRSVFFKSDGTKLYTTYDTTGTVYQHTLSTAWDISTASYDSVSFVADPDNTYNNLKGLSVDSTGTNFYLFDRDYDEVFKYTLSTAWDISTASFSGRVDISGKETTGQGIFVKPDGAKFYITGTASDSVHQYSIAPSATITYPSTLQWSTGTAPTSPAIGETDVITFSTTDGGTSYQAVQAIDGAK